MRWSSQGDEAEEKQRRTPRRCSARADKDKECPGLDHPGQNKKERPKQNDNKKRMTQTRRPGLEHPASREQGLPPLGLDQPGTCGGRTPRTGLSGADQAAGTAAPRTGSSGDKGRPDAPDWIIRGGSGSWSQSTHDTIVDTRGGQTPRTGTSGTEQEGAATTPGSGERLCAAPTGLPGADQPESVLTP